MFNPWADRVKAERGKIYCFFLLTFQGLFGLIGSASNTRGSREEKKQVSYCIFEESTGFILGLFCSTLRMCWKDFL